MVRDLSFPLTVVPVPTVREPDGLALSSRNAYLSPPERVRAARLYRALSAGGSAAAGGPAATLDAAREVLAGDPQLALDYLELRDVALGTDPRRGPARLLGAATLGSTHLIDNIAVDL